MVDRFDFSWGCEDDDECDGGTPRWRGADFQTLLETSIRVHLKRRQSRKSIDQPLPLEPSEDPHQPLQRKLKATKNKWRMQVAAAKQELIEAKQTRAVLEKQLTEAKVACREALVDEQHAAESLQTAKQRVTIASATAHANAEQSCMEQIEAVNVVRKKDKLLEVLQQSQQSDGGVLCELVLDEANVPSAADLVAERQLKVDAARGAVFQQEQELKSCKKQQVEDGHELASLQLQLPVVTRSVVVAKRKQRASAAELGRSTRDREEFSTRLRVAHAEEQRLRDDGIQAAMQRRLEVAEKRRELLAVQAEEPDLAADLDWARERLDEASKQASILQDWRANATKAHLATCGEVQRKLQRTWLASANASTAVDHARTVVEQAVRQRPGGDSRPSSAYSLLSVSAGFHCQSRPTSGHVHNGHHDAEPELQKVSCEADRLAQTKTRAASAAATGCAEVALRGRLASDSALTTWSLATRPSSAAGLARPCSSGSLGRVSSTHSTVASRSQLRPSRPGSVPGKQHSSAKVRCKMRPASSAGRLTGARPSSATC